jgi:plastocyanin
LINTKQIIISSLLVVFAIGLFAVPQAFADHDEVTIENAPGSASPGCEPECFIPSTVTIKADTEVTWHNGDTAAHTATSGDTVDLGPGETPNGYGGWTVV